MVDTYALLRGGRIDTLWYVVADTVPADRETSKTRKLNWWRAVTTNADMFERRT